MVQMQPSVKDFKNIIYDNFIIEHQLNEELIDKAIDGIFKIFNKRDFKKFKIAIDKLSDEIIALEIIADDAAFIVDSTMNLLQRHHCEVVLMSIPVFGVKRDSEGVLESFSEANKDNNESLSLFIVKKSPEIKIEELKAQAEEVLECVFAANEAWVPSKEIISNIITREDDINNKNFLQWLINNNFIFLATCTGDSSGKVENLNGLLKTNYYNYKDVIDKDIGGIIKQSDKIILERTTVMSNVHRNSNMDVIYIVDKSKGTFTAIVGFFTSAVYHQNVMDIPIVKDKIRSVINRYENLHDSGYIVKEVIAQIQEYPRTELFQMNSEEIYSLVGSIISVVLLPRVKIFIRNDSNSNFKSVLIFIPKEKFSMDLYGKIEGIVCEKMSVKVFKKYIHMSEGKIMNVQLIVKSIEDIKYDLNEIEKAVEAVTLSWHDLLRDGLHKLYPNKQLNLFTNAFDPEYIASHTPREAVEDISVIEDMSNKDRICKFIIGGAGYKFRIYSRDNKIEVSDLLPAVENAGFAVTDIVTYCITPGIERIFIHNLDIAPKTNIEIRENLKNDLEPLIEDIISNDHSDNDQFNSLILYCGLSYREVVICRMYSSYLKQLSVQYGKENIIDALVTNGYVTRRLIDLFNGKFQKIGTEPRELEGHCSDIKRDILSELDKIENALHDRILRNYLTLIDATKRTNFFCDKSYASIKIASSEVPFAPLPRPFMEIFVYSNRFEGIHLRGGKVARGGIRWSDRHMDFRTEVLGLMKAQMTKNSVIVPVGSKGGFIVKNITSKDKENFFKEGVECYKLFLRGLLDLTDNFIGTEVIRTKNSVCWDDLDPYLVVAADKGTATFSDYANTMALEYSFWLGDAFASGGSAGYDHKKLAITSRGAWISVMQHFKILGINPNKDEITAVGIGDMSGDVFGNGMLMSKTIKLVAAFNHMHIFIDPKPNAQSSYSERKRLFDKPNSQWSDYNSDLISQGGGIFLRSAKSIELNDEIRNALRIDSSVKSMAPDDLIRAILLAPVDLLWSGGIGTYVKASSEANEQIGDKSNDSLRVNGKDLRCKVIGEGGNLGVTQLGRIEYSAAGGNVNTDAIDNSGGVDCSDHEVNLKIAFAPMLSDKLISLKERNKLLEDMSDNICELVLNDNRLQNQLLSIECYKAKENIAEHAWLIDYLEKTGKLNCEVEKLPSKYDLRRMVANKTPLTRPELAVLLAYAKNSAIEMLSGAEVSDMFEKIPYRDMYLNYFPKLLSSDPKYLKYLLNHRLANEILVTVLVNDLINTMGCTYFHLMVVRQGVSPIKLIKAFCIIKYGLKIDETIKRVEDSGLPSDQTLKLHRLIQTMIGRNVSWILHGQLDEIDAGSDLYKNMNSSINNLISFVISNDLSKSDLIKDILKVENVSNELEKIGCVIAAQWFAVDIFFASQKSGVEIMSLAASYDLMRLKLRFDFLNRRVAESFYKLNYESRIAIMIVMRSLDSLLMKLSVAFITLLGSNKIKSSDLDKLQQLCTNDSLGKYLEFINEIDDWSEQDVVSLLLLLKNRMKAILNSVRFLQK